MDVAGHWFYAKWFGGGCRLAQGEEEKEEEGGGKEDHETCTQRIQYVLFSEGKLKLRLHCSSDGWWEGPPGSGVRLCREGPYLVLERQRSGKRKGKRKVRAATSPWAAACLCYRSTLSGVFLRPAKTAPRAPAAAPRAEVQ